MQNMKIGFIGLMEDDSPQNFWDVMQHVATLGYEGCESAEDLLKGDVVANLQRFHNLGLQVITVSTSTKQLRDDVDAVIAKAHVLQAPHASIWWSACASREEIRRDADIFNRAGKKLAAAGITLCYHNHEHEFRHRFNGLYALDLLAEYTDPQALSFEIDIAWVTYGGEDPVNVLNKYAGRVAAIHVKDLFCLDARGQFTATGTGIVRVRESVRTAIDTGVAWAVIEQDSLRNLSAQETLTLSYLYLKEAGLV